MAWIVLAVVVAAAVATVAVAQKESGEGGGRPIERPFTAVMEVFIVSVEFASEPPFSGDPSDFDGLCSEPADLVYHSRFGGLDSIFGHFNGTGSLCVRAEWGVDANGAPTMTGMRYLDMVSRNLLPDGSAIEQVSNVQWDGFDEETGQLLSTFSWTTSGGGTGRYAGSSSFCTVSCRWHDPEAVGEGREPELCTMQGLFYDDPFAGMGE
jgi:hypothetical protein